MIIGKIDRVLAKHKSMARNRKEMVQKVIHDPKNITCLKSGSNRFLFKVIDNTRRKSSVASAKARGLTPSASQNERALKELKEQKEHQTLCERVFAEHESSKTRASLSSARASSASKRMQNTVTGATNVIDTYKKANESFKQNCRERLTKVLAE